MKGFSVNIEDLNSATLALELTIKERAEELSVCEFWILHELYSTPKQAVVQLSLKRGRTFQTVARVCYNLQEKGLIIVEVNDDDRRARVIDLTAAGRKIYFKAAGAVRRKLTTMEREAS